MAVSPKDAYTVGTPPSASVTINRQTTPPSTPAGAFTNASIVDLDRGFMAGTHQPATNNQLYPRVQRSRRE